MDYKAKQAAEASAVAALVACNPHLVPAASCKGELWRVPFDGGYNKQNVQDLVSEAAYRQCYALSRPYINAAQAEEV